MKRYIIYIVAALALTVNAQDARYKLLNIDYKLLQSGVQEKHVRKELTIYTHAAMNETYGETFIEYDAKYQKVKINESYVIRKDGTRINTTENALVNQLPRAAVRAPFYNSLTELVVVHQGLTLGSTIVLDYTITTQANYLPSLIIDLNIEERSPIDNLSVSITVPQNETLKYESKGIKEKGASTNSGYTKYEFFERNIPAVEPESFAPAAYRLAANTIANTASQQKLATLSADVIAQLDSVPLTGEQVGFKTRSIEDIMASGYATTYELSQLRDISVSSITSGRETVRLTLDKDGDLFNGEDYYSSQPEKAGDYMVLRLPNPATLKSQALSFPNSVRTRPIELPQTYDEEIEIRVALPSNILVTRLPKDVVISNSVGEVKVQWQMFTSNQAHSLISIRTLKINRKSISVKEYEQLRALTSAWLDSNTYRVLSKRLF